MFSSIRSHGSSYHKIVCAHRLCIVIFLSGPTTNGLDDDGREASPMENQVEIIKEDGGFKIVCCIPSSLFPHIIGFKGAVKKRIELETRTRIYVPRQNEKGDIGK